MRIGYGYDSHAFIEGNHIMLGGVKIPFEKSVRAHSDGDVLLHALIDAMLGAAALGDIGQHFPDTDPRYQSKPSSEFLLHTMQMLHKLHYRVINIDSTIITEAPKLKKYINDMRQHIATRLEISVDAVNIKAKTNEKMGWIGRGEGLAASVVVLLNKNNF